MNKKILTSVVVLSGLLFGGDVFATDYINIEGEGICEMVLPANAIMKKNDSKDFEFSASKDFFLDDDIGDYVGFDKLLEQIHQVLPDAVITSYKYDIYDEGMFFNMDTKLQKDLIGLVEGVYYAENKKDISDNLTKEFTSSKEYLDCKDMAVKAAMKNAMDKAKIFKAKIVATDNPKYGSYDKSYIYKMGDDKMIYHYSASYKAVAD